MKTCFIYLVGGSILFLLSCKDDKQSYENKKIGFMSDTSFTGKAFIEQASSILAENQQVTYEQFLSHKKILSEQSQILAVSQDQNIILVADKVYEGYACSFASFNVSLITFRKNQLVYKLPCTDVIHDSFTSDLYIQQEDTLTEIFFSHKLKPVFDSLIFLTKEEIINRYSISENLETRKIQEFTYIKNYALLHKDSILLNMISAEHDYILKVRIKGAWLFSKSSNLLICMERHTLEGSRELVYTLITP